MYSRATKFPFIPHEPDSEFLCIQGQIEHLIFVDCLERFAQRIRQIYNLESEGTIDCEKALESIQLSLEMLYRAKQDLGISEEFFPH